MEGLQGWEGILYAGPIKCKLVIIIMLKTSVNSIIDSPDISAGHELKADLSLNQGNSLVEIMVEKVRTFYDDGKHALEAALRGFVALHPQLRLHEQHKGLCAMTPRRDAAAG